MYTKQANLRTTKQTFMERPCNQNMKFSGTFWEKAGILAFNWMTFYYDDDKDPELL